MVVWSLLFLRLFKRVFELGLGVGLELGLRLGMVSGLGLGTGLVLGLSLVGFYVSRPEATWIKASLRLAHSHVLTQSQVAWQLMSKWNEIVYVEPKLTNGFVQNKAGYTATPVACRWAGAVQEKVITLEHLGRSSRPKKLKNAEKVKKGTNRPTNRLTDRRTDIAGCRVGQHATKNLHT